MKNAMYLGVKSISSTTVDSLSICLLSFAFDLATASFGYKYIIYTDFVNKYRRRAILMLRTNANWNYRKTFKIN